MKSRIKSSKKAEERSLKLKLLQGLIYSSLQMGSELCLQRLKYHLTKKAISKNHKALKPKFVLETNFCKSHNSFKIST